jgi:hypothetical protein
MPLGAVLVRKRTGPVDGDLPPTTPAAIGHDDVGPDIAEIAETPERGGAPVTQHSAFPACDDRRHPAAVLSEARVADCVNASVEEVQSTCRETMLDGGALQTERSKLALGYDAMLTGRESSHLAVRWAEFAAHTPSNSAQLRHRFRVPVVAALINPSTWRVRHAEVTQ